MLRRVRVPNDVPHPGPEGAPWPPRSTRGSQLVWNNRTLLALAWLAGLWQILHHMQLAVLILFATRELGLSAGAIGLVYAFGGAGLRARVGVGASGCRRASASGRSSCTGSR